MNRIYFKNNANLKLVQRCIYFAISVVFCAKKKIGITECDYLHFQFFFPNRDGNLKRNEVKSEWKAMQQEAFSHTLKVE